MDESTNLIFGNIDDVMAEIVYGGDDGNNRESYGNLQYDPITGELVKAYKYSEDENNNALGGSVLDSSLLGGSLKDIIVIQGGNLDDSVLVENTNVLNSNNGINGEVAGSGVSKNNKKPVSKVITEVFDTHNECHFGNGSNVVCSPKHIVAKMKDYARSKNRIDLISKDEKSLVAGMKDLLNCQSESCILKRNDFIDFAKIANVEDILNEFFKPSGPAVNFGLLSNFNIDDVLDQFEKKFANRKFLHIPFQMRDFEKIGTQLSTIDLAKEFKKYETFGVVLNTDYSTGKGIHWFCIFGENYKTHIELEYFNSSGKEPLPEVQAWLQKTKHYLTKATGLPTSVFYSTGIMFQHDDHSCGLYSLAYIWLRLEKVSPKWFKADNFNDVMMHKIRKNMFRWEV